MTHDRSQLSGRQGRIKLMIQVNILYEYERVYVRRQAWPKW